MADLDLSALDAFPKADSVATDSSTGSLVTLNAQVQTFDVYLDDAADGTFAEPEDGTASPLPFRQWVRLYEAHPSSRLRQYTLRIKSASGTPNFFYRVN